jgi:hypothetical protein
MPLSSLRAVRGTADAEGFPHRTVTTADWARAVAGSGAQQPSPSPAEAAGGAVPGGPSEAGGSSGGGGQGRPE